MIIIKFFFIHQDCGKTYLVDIGDTVIVDVKPPDCPLRLVMLDVGMTSSLNEDDLWKFKAVFTAVVAGDVWNLLSVYLFTLN